MSDSGGMELPIRAGWGVVAVPFSHLCGREAVDVKARVLQRFVSSRWSVRDRGGSCSSTTGADFYLTSARRARVSKP